MVNRAKFLAKHHNARIKAVPSKRIKDLIAFTKIECNAIAKKDTVARARQMVHKEIEVKLHVLKILLISLRRRSKKKEKPWKDMVFGMILLRET